MSEENQDNSEAKEGGTDSEVLGLCGGFIDNVFNDLFARKSFVVAYNEIKSKEGNDGMASKQEKKDELNSNSPPLEKMGSTEAESEVIVVQVEPQIPDPEDKIKLRGETGEKSSAKEFKNIKVVDEEKVDGKNKEEEEKKKEGKKEGDGDNVGNKGSVDVVEQISGESDVKERIGEEGKEDEEVKESNGESNNKVENTEEAVKEKDKEEQITSDKKLNNKPSKTQRNVPKSTGKANVKSNSKKVVLATESNKNGEKAYLKKRVLSAKPNTKTGKVREHKDHKKKNNVLSVSVVEFNRKKLENSNEKTLNLKSPQIKASHIQSVSPYKRKYNTGKKIFTKKNSPIKVINKSQLVESMKEAKETDKERRLYEKKLLELKNRINSLKKQDDDLNKRLYLKKEREKDLTLKRKQNEKFKETLKIANEDKRNELEDKKRQIALAKEKLDKDLRYSYKCFLDNKFSKYKQAKENKDKMNNLISENQNKLLEKHKNNALLIKKERERVKEEEQQKRREKLEKIKKETKILCEENIRKTNRIKDEIAEMEKLEEKYMQNLKSVNDELYKTEGN